MMLRRLMPPLCPPPPGQVFFCCTVAVLTRSIAGTLRAGGSAWGLFEDGILFEARCLCGPPSSRES